ncbi:hypothetical protein C8J56DRAFT_1030246 [Mycena floridula]|nr:hypothetical protein C8J56DRAFT_1030246 [Mycena floridula]
MEEIVHLVDDVEQMRYPDSPHHSASSDIFSLSMANRQFRRICLPILFSCISCRTLEELENLERECIVKSAFTGFIKTLVVDVDIPGLITARQRRIPGFVSDNTSVRDSLLTRLLPLLDSLLWLEIREEGISESLLNAINVHTTLKTGSTPSVEGASLDTVPRKIPLDKLLVRSSSSHDLSLILERNIRLANVYISDDMTAHTETMLRDLRMISVFDRPDIRMDVFDAFVAHHSSLTRVTIYHVNALGWEEFTFSKRHGTSSFLDAVEAQSLRATIHRFDVTLSPRESNSFKTGFDGWQVIGLDVQFKSSPVAMVLVLAGTMFPKVTSLSISLPSTVKSDDKIHIDAFVVLISQYFPNLRALDLYLEASGLLTWTVKWNPMYVEFPNEPVELQDTLGCLRTLAWRMFQTSSPTATIRLFTSGKTLDESLQWHILSVYKAQRNQTRAIVKLEIWIDGRISRQNVLAEESEARSLKFRGSVVL